MFNDVFEMKSFIKVFFSSCLGVFVALFLVIVFGVFVIIGAVASIDSEKPVKLKENTVLKLDMSSLQDKVKYSILDQALGNGNESVCINDIINSIRKAKENPNIDAIYINVPYISGGVSAINEVREALADFKKSGKPIVAYADSYTQEAYLLSSMADKVILNPEGAVNIVGVALPTMMFQSLLQKVGVKMEVFKVGKFKGAVEPYVLNKLSDENRLQLQQLSDGIWNNMTDEICHDRKIDKSVLLEFVNRGGAFDEAKEFVKLGLVDTLAYRSDVENIVASLIDKDTESLRMTTVREMTSVPFLHKEKGEKICVIYAEGQIMPKGETSQYDKEVSINEDIIDRINEVKKDDDIKAVVLRVNSPGGSAFLSEQIWKSLKDLSEKKPIVTSMGHMAASGGYYISSGTQYIVAERNTITGSIGIFGMIPNAQELAGKLGVSVDVVKTSPYADLQFGLNNIITPMDNGAKELIQRQVERGYQTFLSRVSSGRNMSKEKVDSIGQGRVWLGDKALEIGLVDELGGLDVAIKKAAEMASLKEYIVIHQNKESDKILKTLLNTVDDISDRFKARMLGKEFVSGSKHIENIFRQSGLQAVMPYEIKY